MTSAAVASLCSSSSSKTWSICWTSSSMSWGRVAMSCVLWCGLADELVEQHAGDHVERLENAFALVSGTLECRHLDFAVVDQVVHVFHRRDVGQIALVVLEDVGDVGEVEPERLQILFEVGETLHVLCHLLVLRIRHEHD